MQRGSGINSYEINAEIQENLTAYKPLFKMIFGLALSGKLENGFGYIQI